MWWTSKAPETRDAIDAYAKAIEKTAGMVRDPQVASHAARHGLRVVNLTWEDTARYKGSAVGPNISDLTIAVRHPRATAGSPDLAAMPVIRAPNFGDRTADVPLDQLQVLVGNERGEALRPVSLRTYLDDLRAYLHHAKSWPGTTRSLLAPRDTHALVSAQACFLPVPQGDGVARFHPVLMNYQSRPDDPAVLTVLATREGTSAAILDGRGTQSLGRYTWGLPLYFNRSGQRCAFTAQRLTAFVAKRKAEKATADAAMGGEEHAAESTEGLNVLLLLQIPLAQKPRPAAPLGVKMKPASKAAAGGAGEEEEEEEEEEESDVEEAVLGHGEDEGPHGEVGGHPIKRDVRFPVRVTVQFYKATSNGVASSKDIDAIASQIERVYANGAYVGSLVTDGVTARPTEPMSGRREPPTWWSRFWESYEQETGTARVDAIRRLSAALGDHWVPIDEESLRAAVTKSLSRSPPRAKAKAKAKPKAKAKVASPPKARASAKPKVKAKPKRSPR